MPAARDPVIIRFLISVRRTRFGAISSAGALLALLAYIGSNTPSLLPRPWYFQGVIAGICSALAYGLGEVLGRAGSRFARWIGLRVTMKRMARLWLVRLWTGLLAAVVLAFPLTSLEWQRVTAETVGWPAPGPWHVVASGAAAALVFTALVFAWRGLAALTDAVTVRIEHRVARESIARIVASVLTGSLILVGIQFVVLPGGLMVAERQADRVNARSPQGRVPPHSPARSGGPGSTQTWEELGQDGAIFVTSGPTAGQIAAATGRPAREPIRVFGALRPGGSIEDSCRAALAELDRTRAWDRRAILVMSATSTGYVNLWSAASFEVLGDGDTAIVSAQYSTLPSVVAFLGARAEPPEAGRALWRAVAARVAQLPVDRRPKLYASGESLGAYAGNGAFDSPEDMVGQVDGAVWSGTPEFTPIRRTLTARRNPGSTVVTPVVDLATHIRFAGNADQLTADQFGRPYGTWAFPRVVYLQHASDPIVWWTSDLLFTTPPWLQETRLEAPTSQMSWFPLVTFWQVTADMGMSNDVPGGHGHRYVDSEMVPAWAAVLGLSTDRDTSAVRSLVHDSSWGIRDDADVTDSGPAPPGGAPTGAVSG